MSLAPVIASVVDSDALLKTVLAAIVSGLGVTLIFSLAIFGAARSIEYGADGKRTAAALMGGLSVLAVAISVAAVVAGIIVMTSK